MFRPASLRLAAAAAAALALVGVLIARRAVVSAQATPVDDQVVSFRVQFGVGDAEPRAWDGSLTAAAGEVVRVRNWHSRPGDVVEGRSWKLATRSGVNFVMRPWDTDRPMPPVLYLLIPGIVVDVRGTSATRVRFETPQGGFEVSPFALEAASPVSQLGGAVIVDRVPVAATLSGGDRNAEFPALVAAENGELWAAWVAYAGGRNVVEMRHFDGRAWGAPQTVSGDHRDIFLVKLARDGAGRVWATWSAQVGGNFDLYARRWDGRAWSAVERLTTDPQPDIYHNMATDSRGHVWIVWQGFRGGASDILARRHDGSAWLAEEKVSASPANDWLPAIAADGAGRVWVGWDTYDKGNYDVMIRRHENGSWGQPIPAASTPLFEANVSLACDRQNRLWAAWNESGAEWGKDTGFLLKIEGTRLYASRWMRVLVFDGTTWRQPADVERSLPEELRGYNDMPALAAASDGRVWLFFRHRLLRIRDTPSDSPAHRAAWEIHGTTYQSDRWTTELSNAR